MTPRAIKFRAWDKYRRTMQMDPGHEPGDTQVTILNDDFFKDEWLVFMQFTGLHDRNGKEIYEGDICRFLAKPEDGLAWKAAREYVGEACWDEEDAGFFYATRTAWPHIKPWFAQLVEVIGNIYEHQQLLEARP